VTVVWPCSVQPAGSGPRGTRSQRTDGIAKGSGSPAGVVVTVGVGVGVGVTDAGAVGYAEKVGALAAEHPANAISTTRAPTALKIAAPEGATSS
jgi:hypothetical protein